jgi:hypothetical protein
MNLGDRPALTRSAWVWVATIDGYSFINRANLNGEATTHELTHTWDVNAPFANGGHCDQKDYANSNLKCLMRPGNDWVVGTSVAAEYYDGVVRYHYAPTAASVSEYIDECKHQEPIQ